jgi:hypothetical protein
MGGEDIVRFIKARRIQWLGHVERMDETAMPKRVLKGKLCAARRIGRPRIRWMEDVITDIRKMGISGWKERARNRDQWRRIVEEAKAHQGCSAEEKNWRLSQRLNFIMKIKLRNKIANTINGKR